MYEDQVGNGGVLLGYPKNVTIGRNREPLDRPTSNLYSTKQEPPTAKNIVAQFGPASRAVAPPLLSSNRRPAILMWEGNMNSKTEVWQGTLALMVLKTLNALGPQHGYGVARRIEQTSDNLLSINHGTLYPVLLKLEQEGAIASEWGVSENNRRAKFYRITKSGRKQLDAEVTQWSQANEIIGRFLALKETKA
jgi:PadR family transcriptional regulator, regulatory protein PadR